MERQNRQIENVKVGDLTPQSKNFNLSAKVISVGEAKEIPAKFGGSPNRVAEALIGDETGNVLFSVWNNQIDDVNEGDVLSLENAYVTLVRGHMRVNIGKFGKFGHSDDEVDADAGNTNLSDQEHEQPRRDFNRGGGRGGGGFGGGRGGGGGFRY
jgi:replication factor A1